MTVASVVEHAPSLEGGQAPDDSRRGGRGPTRRPAARERSYFLPLSCAAAGFLLVALLRLTGGVQALELPLYDAFTRALRARDRVVDPYVAVVLVTEDDIGRFGWPLPEDSLASLVRRLTSAGAVAVGLDLYRDSVRAAGPLNAAARSGRVVFARRLGGAEPAVPPPRNLAAEAPVGFTDVVLDDDDAVRRLFVLADDAKETHRSLAFQLARSLVAGRGIRESAAADGLPQLGRWTVRPFLANDGGYVRADDAGYQQLIPYRYAPRLIAAATASRILTGAGAPDFARGRVVLIGVDAPSLPDLVRLPVAVAPGRPAGTPGVVAQALATSVIVRLAVGGAEPLRVVREWTEWLLLVVAALAGAVASATQRSVPRVVAALGIGLLALAVLGYGALAVDLWVPVAGPALGLVGSGAGTALALSVRERRARETLMRLFERHLSPELADLVWAHRAEFLDGGRPRAIVTPVTTLFVDLRGYTSLAERTEPQALMEWIGEFTDAMASVVMRHGGLVDDYAGDGIKADFGVPIPRHDAAGVREDAQRAVACARAMAGVLDELDARWRAEGRAGVAMRIGVASGTAVAGTIGSSDRLKYTVVGDSVNLASRLESFDGVPWDADHHPCRILIDAATYSSVEREVACEALGEFTVKGRSAPVAIYRVRHDSARASV